MRFKMAIDVHTMELYNGRTSFYAHLTIGPIDVFVSRWDSVRVLPKPRQFDIYRGSEMTWYAGSF